MRRLMVIKLMVNCIKFKPLMALMNTDEIQNYVTNIFLNISVNRCEWVVKPFCL
jgi:hypothetical protein